MNKEKQIKKISKSRQEYLKFKPFADDLRKAESWCELDGVLNRYQTVKKLSKMGYRKQSENVIELPCKVGTTLYFLYNSPYADKPDLAPRIYQTTNWCFEIDKTGIVINTSDIHSFNKNYDYFLGETVFFTKEEAEKAIAELKKKYTDEGK